jgi:hypothetical protein
MRVRLEDLGAKQKFLANKEDILKLCAEESVGAISLFINQCCEMAEANWCPSQVEMLKRLFNAVLKNEPYAEQPEGVEE